MNEFKCDLCGRFIGYKELSEGGGASGCFIPDSEVSCEEIAFRCKKCTEKEGVVLSRQYPLKRNSYRY